MLPGTQSNLATQTVQAWHTAHAAAVHAAVQSTTTNYRNAALLDLADRLVGHLPAHLLQRLGIQSTTTKVLISAETQRHAIARRAISSQIDAELVASRIAEAFANVQYLLFPQRNPNVPLLLGRVESADKWMVLPLKFIRADSSKSHADEFWIATAYPLGRTNFDIAKKKGLLIQVKRDLEFNSA